jgi:hypothetical protein
MRWAAGRGVGDRGPSGKPRCTGPHGAAWGRMGPHGAWGPEWGPSKVQTNKQTKTRPGKKGNRNLFKGEGGKARGRLLCAASISMCCVGVGCWLGQQLPTTHWNCHQSTPSLLIYLLLTPPSPFELNKPIVPIAEQNFVLCQPLRPARKRAGSWSRGTYEARGATRNFRTEVGSSTRRHPVARR